MKHWKPFLEQRAVSGLAKCRLQTSARGIQFAPARSVFEHAMIDRMRLILIIISSWSFFRCTAFGSMNSIAISYGDDPVVCAVQASQQQEVLCWGRNSTFEQSSMIPPLMGLSGGSGFICGLQASGNSQAFCFRTNFSRTSSTNMNNIVPGRFQDVSYEFIAAGETHICATQLLSQSSSSSSSSLMDCWRVQEQDQEQDDDANINNLLNNAVSSGKKAVQVVAGKGFSCSLDHQGKVFCWGNLKEELDAKILFESISAGTHHVCGIQKISSQAKCWGNNDNRQLDSPDGIQFAFLAAGSDHTCGIRKDTHELHCWGSMSSRFRSRIPSKTAFLSLASGSGMSCGIREGNLLADCWGGMSDGNPAVPEYSPPPELFSPGICAPVSSCDASSGYGGQSFFTFNASNHGVPEVDGICGPSRRICSPCATDCPNGTFRISACSENEDRVCVECSVCETEECEKWCSIGGGLRNSSSASSSSSQRFDREERSQKRRNILILAAVSSSFVLLVLILMLLRIRRMLLESRRKSPPEDHCAVEIQHSSSSKALIVKAEVQIFRLQDLRDATNGFKEMNEIGRGRYGTVYKAALPDGTQLAVKRASAARRIQFNSKEFESELEILCKMRHENLVNLVGYCDQMGERLLAYEFMSNGSLFDHLHGENKGHSCAVATRWGMRVAVAAQAARGLEFLHSSKPPVIHGSLKSSNVMLDRDWNARVADFALLGCEYASFESGYGGTGNPGRLYGGQFDGHECKGRNLSDDVYSFGVVMLELLTGRTAVMGGMFDPPVRLVDWAIPMIERGKFETLVDPGCNGELLSHSSSKQGLFRFAEIAEMCLSPKPPSMVEVSSWLQDLTLHHQQHHHHHHHHLSPNIACINFKDSF